MLYILSLLDCHKRYILTNLKTTIGSREYAIVPGTNLTNSQLTALDALVAGKTIYQAAKLAGTRKIVVEQWLGLDEFQAEYRKASALKRKQFVNELVELGSSSVKVLQKTLRSKNPGRRLAAAKAGLTAVAPIAKSTVDAAEGIGTTPLFQLPAGCDVSLTVDVAPLPETPASVVVIEAGVTDLGESL